MGSELYAYFDIKAPRTSTPSSSTSSRATPAWRTSPAAAPRSVVARLSADSGARPGREIELTLDTSQIKLFDPDGGRSLTSQSA